jgi:hypothetical protein
MQQRYYDAESGRFLSVDPVTPDGSTGGNFNRYWYANDNPYRYTDPDGRWADTDFSAGQGTRSYAADVMAHPDRPLTPIDKVIVAVGAAAAAASGLGEVVAIAKSAATADKALSNGAAVTRYMGPEEAKVAARTGEIPNVGKDGIPRPTHVTKDAPLDSAAKAQARYELPTAPTHRATVPANRATDLGRTPDGRATTSGGGSQNATNHPIPVKPEEIKRLDH